MNNLQVFSNEQFGEIRCAIHDGEPWFAAADVCKSLGVGNASAAVSRIDPEETTLISIEGASNSLPINMVSEAGLYELILGSRKREAKQFKRWVVHDVLPTIRKTGGYVANEDLFVESYFPEINDAAKLVLKTSLSTIKRQQEQLEAQQPLVDFANHVSDTADLLTMSQMAKIAYDEHINIGRNKLFDWLRDRGYLRPNNEPYQEFIDRGYFKVKETRKDTMYGTQFYTQTFVTGRGQIYFIEKLRSEFGCKAS